MKVLHLASSNRWTGAAAPAFAEVEALRAAGIDARYAYVGGYRLEQKLAEVDFALPLIRKRQSPSGLIDSVGALRRVVVENRIDILHSHLTYDHFLGSLVKRGSRAALARTFHSRRTLRRDPFTSALLSATDGIGLINAEMELPSERFRKKPHTWTPPPVDHRIFRPDGESVRASLQVPTEGKVIGIIGKLAPNRGFEEAILCLAAIHRLDPSVRLMIIGHANGPHRPVIAELAQSAGVGASLIWAGYHEEDLADYYRACDAMIFTAPGSDEGHRAILEEMACGVPPVSYPIKGVRQLIGDLSDRLVTSVHHPEAMAKAVLDVLGEPDRTSLQEGVSERSHQFGFETTARRLVDFYHEVLRRRRGSPSA
ncbi:MAG TPA: glycosyltransferase family 4 protein [Thermoanaerobaculia bacterium]|nr:glycosyltransferase family 4 protein [Thermoanaerobaculia bacterium]